MDEATQVGPLATRRPWPSSSEQVRRSVAHGGAACCAAARASTAPGSSSSRRCSPTCPRDSPAYAEELFGPVAALFGARDVDDAIRIANDTRFGLGRQRLDARRSGGQSGSPRELEAGSVFVNAMVASDPRFPFGGVKASGYGRELSAFGLREFVNVKTVRVRL